MTDIIYTPIQTNDNREQILAILYSEYIDRDVTHVLGAPIDKVIEKMEADEESSFFLAVFLTKYVLPKEEKGKYYDRYLTKLVSISKLPYSYRLRVQTLDGGDTSSRFATFGKAKNTALSMGKVEYHLKLDDCATLMYLSPKNK